MTKPTSVSANKKTIGLNDQHPASFDHRRNHDQQSTASEGETYQPLISTAILTTTAFRLRDESALIAALRLLVQAVKPFESDASDAPDRHDRRED